MFLPAILIPVCASSSPAFHMIYSAYKLNKQGDNIQPYVLLSLFGKELPRSYLVTRLPVRFNFTKLNSP